MSAHIHETVQGEQLHSCRAGKLVRITSAYDSNLPLVENTEKITWMNLKSTMRNGISELFYFHDIRKKAKKLRKEI